MEFRVDQGLCRRCGICADVCPARIIGWEKAEVPYLRPGGAERCIRCGQCMAFCPTLACAAPGLDREDAPQLRPEKMPDAAAVEELVFRRRSIRNFKDMPVPEGELRHLMDIAAFAPSSKNSQPVRWIGVCGRDKVERIAHLCTEWLEALPQNDPALAQAMAATGLARVQRSGYDVLLRGAPSLVIAVTPADTWGPIDGAIALTYLELAACGHGIGACWAGYLTIAATHPSAAALREHLGIRDGERMAGGQMLGYPRYRPYQRPPRKTTEVSWL